MKSTEKKVGSNGDRQHERRHEFKKKEEKMTKTKASKKEFEVELTSERTDLLKVVHYHEIIMIVKAKNADDAKRIALDQVEGVIDSASMRDMKENGDPVDFRPREGDDLHRAILAVEVKHTTWNVDDIGQDPEDDTRVSIQSIESVNEQLAKTLEASRNVDIATA